MGKDLAKKEGSFRDQKFLPSFSLSLPLSDIRRRSKKTVRDRITNQLTFALSILNRTFLSHFLVEFQTTKTLNFKTTKFLVEARRTGTQLRNGSTFAKRGNKREKNVKYMK